MKHTKILSYQYFWQWKPQSWQTWYVYVMQLNIRITSWRRVHQIWLNCFPCSHNVRAVILICLKAVSLKTNYFFRPWFDFTIEPKILNRFQKRMCFPILKQPFKLRCNTRFKRAFAARGFVFKVITLVGSQPT